MMFQDLVGHLKCCTVARPIALVSMHGLSQEDTATAGEIR